MFRVHFDKGDTAAKVYSTEAALSLRSRRSGTKFASQGGCRTASELCARTRILKSQMNAILRSLEEQGVIARQRSLEDRRRVELQLLPAGLERYRASHQKALNTVDRLIGGMGEDKARQLLPLLRRAADTFDTMQKEI